MSRHNLAWLLGIGAICLFGLAVTLGSPSRAKEQDYELVRLFVDVLHQVRHRYVRELSAEQERKLVEDMINGGLDRLDQHSHFINSREYQQLNKHSEGKFGGVGIHISKEGDSIVVTSPMVDTPAYKAGILAGDIILKIDDKSTEGMRLSEVVDLIQGEADTKIRLTVRHEDGKVEDITIVRAEIHIPSVMGDLRKPKNIKEWDYLLDKENKIGYIRLTGFNKNAAEELSEVVQELKQLGMRGLIIDLRNNTGGLFKSAREICNLFISQGRIVSTKGRDQEEEVYDAEPKHTILGPDSNCPMAILVNHSSASASEIVAACLQHHKRAVIVGERSYGKGSVQNIIPLENGRSALKLTTAVYLPPSGKNIHRFPNSKETDEWGVRPDEGLALPLTPKDHVAYNRWRHQRDVVREKPAPQNKKDDKKEEPFVDKVLEKALEYLRGKINQAGIPGVPEVAPT